MNTMHESPGTRHAQEGAQAASILLDLDYRLVPVAGKNPYEMGWYEKPYPIFVLQERLARGDNLGMLFGQELADGTFLVALDADLTIPALAAAVRAKMGDVSARIGRRPKFLIPIRVRPEDSFSRDYHFYESQKVGAARQSIQILGRASKAPHRPKQAVVYGDHPDTGKPYFWEPDSQGRSIYQMRPTDWPLIPNLESLMLDISATMATLGWNCRHRGAATEGGGEFGAEITAEMVDDAQRLFEQGLDDVSTRGAGANRGTSVYTLGLQVGMLVKRGLLDLDQCKRAVDAAMPDDAGHASYEFENGVNNSKGFRQQKIHEKRNPDWAGAAKAQGFDFEEVIKGAQSNEGSFKAEEKADAKEIYRRPLIATICNLLADALRKTSLVDQAVGEKLCWGFMSSLLAAGMASVTELSDEWEKKAQQLQHSPRCREPALNIKEAIPLLQPSEAAWAESAAYMMAGGLDAVKAIHNARMAQNETPKGEPVSAEAQEIIRSINMLDWDRTDPADSQSDAQDKSFSNFAFFLGACLDAWPMFDTFTDRVTFMRLRGLSVVSDAELKQWSGNPEAAVAGLYAKATDRRMSWGSVNYTPAIKDIEIWLRLIAEQRVFNSMSKRLRAWEPWDGRRRIDDWLARYTGHRHEDADYEYVCLLGAYWLSGFAARAESPGTKFDLTIVLAGLGGSAKTGLLRTIANTVAKDVSDDAFVESGHLKFDGASNHNHVAMATVGKLIVEMAEARDLKGHNAEGLKAILTPLADEGRGINGKGSYRKPRQFVTAMTVNGIVPGVASGGVVAKELAELQKANPAACDARVRKYMAVTDFSFLQDPTGNRRLAVVKTLAYAVDVQALAKEVPQLISEARERASEFGLVDRGSHLEMVMPLDLRAMIGGRESSFVASGDMVQRLQDELAQFAPDEHGLIVVLKDMREWMQLKTRAERDALQVAFERLGFQHHHGAGNAVWYVRGPLADAKHAIATRKDGRVTGFGLGGSWGSGKTGRPPVDTGVFTP